MTGTFKNGEQLLSEIVLTRDPRLYRALHGEWTTEDVRLECRNDVRFTLYELWVGGYDEGQNAALESGNYATGYKI